MRGSSFSSPSWLSSCSGRSSSSWAVVIAVLVPLLLVPLLLFGVDFRAYSSSSSSSSPFSVHASIVSDGVVGSLKGEEEHVKFHLDPIVNEGKDQHNKLLFNSSSDQVVHHAPVSFQLAAPSPAPQPSPGKAPVSSSAQNVHPTPRRVKRRDIKLERVELDLLRARAAIKEAARTPSGGKSLIADKDYVPQGPVYRNPHAFHRSYLEMEKLFRVYVYEEGEPPLFHDGPCKSIYSMEGRFIHNMEMEKKLRTRDPSRAHVFFLPFSVVKMIKFMYKPNSFDIEPLKRTVVDYIDVVSSRYPYWNRSLGADHFMLSCHDWGPHMSAATPNLHFNSIRVLCNANASEGFSPSKDVTLPEINLQNGRTTGIIGGPSPSQRPILAFFAGGLHGHIRSIVLKHWQDKDPDIQVHQYLPKGVSYYDMMRKSKYCICPSGYEVASPRIVEAIYLECVPVIISDNYVLPFSDALNWKAFSVQVDVKDIPNLKDILMNISPRQHIRMQRRVKTVQRHFVVSTPPQRFDVYHMILHSIWLRRLNIRIELPD